MPQLKVQNYYTPTITAFTGALWDATFTLSVAPTYSYGYIVLAADNINLREIVYYHDKVGNTISVRAENRGLGGTTPKQHGTKETCAMKDVAEIFNFFSDNISQCFNIEKIGGLTIKVWWGTVFYNGVQVTVADTNLTLADNTTNYVKYSFPTNTISFDASNTGNIKAIISTLGGVITSITYKVAKESFIDFTVAITGALPPQAGNAGKFLQTDSANVSWQSVVVPSASTTVAGSVEIPTTPEVRALTANGWTGAPLPISAQQMVSYYSFWDASDGDVTISVNSTLSRDMYYNNLTVNTGVTLDPSGYAIYVAWTLTLTGTAKIIRNGNNWSNASGATAWTGWAALATWTCWPCLGWSNGATWWAAAWAAWVNWIAVTTSYATTWTISAAWWAAWWWWGWGWAWWTSASATQWVLYNTAYNFNKIISGLISPSRWLLAAVSAYGGLPSSWWGWAWWGNWTLWGWGGWAGWNWWIIFIYANNIAWTGTVESKWWIGWNWWASWTNWWGWGWGWGWGCWWIVYLIYSAWTPWTFTLTGWAWWAWSVWNSWWWTWVTWWTWTIWQSIIINV